MKKYFLIFLFLILLTQCWGELLSVNNKNESQTESALTNNITVNLTKKVKEQSVVKSKILLMKERTKRTVNLQAYAYEIFRELNYYRRKQHYFPRIRWYRKLMITSNQEVDHIIKSKSFGQHDNFRKWHQAIRNRQFTEIVLHIHTNGRIPPKRVFAKTIIESIKQKKEWYMIHPYTHGAVSIQKSKGRNCYMVVLHLARLGRYRKGWGYRRYFKNFKKGALVRRKLNRKQRTITKGKRRRVIRRIIGKKGKPPRKTRIIRKVIRKRIIKNGKPKIIRRRVVVRRSKGKRIIGKKGKPPRKTRIIRRVVIKRIIRNGKPKIIKKVIKRRIVVRRVRRGKGKKRRLLRRSRKIYRKKR